MTVTIAPGPAQGTVEAIPSKSAAHRLFLAAALGDRPARIICRGSDQHDAECRRIEFISELSDVLFSLFRSHIRSKDE